MTPDPGQERDVVRALSRGLDVILAFSGRGPRLTLAEVAAATGLSRPTARRLLLTLANGGFVTSDGPTYQLTPRVLALGYAYLSSLNLTETAQPFMEDVVHRTGEGCSLATLDGTEVVYVTRVPTHRIASVTLAVGTRLPAHATSMGHVLLAGLGDAALERYLDRADLVALTSRTVRDRAELLARLEQVRRQGWAMVDQELETGLRSVAAPVRDASGDVIAALSSSSLTMTTSVAELRTRHVPVLVEAAAQISRRLGGPGDAGPGDTDPD